MADLKKQFDDARSAASNLTVGLRQSARERAQGSREGFGRGADGAGRRIRCIGTGTMSPPIRRLPPRFTRRPPTTIRRRSQQRTAGRDRRGAERGMSDRSEERRRRDRGHQGAADGASDRAALAADQGADRVRDRLRVLFLLRQADLQHAGLAVRLGGGPGEFQIHLHGAARIFPHPAQARDVRRGLSRPFRWSPRRSTCSSRPASIATSGRPSCRI